MKISKVICLVVILLVDCSISVVSGQESKTSDLLQPNLRMPFPKGTVILCVQGNLSPTGFSHSIDRTNCLFSFDFLNPTIKDLEIVSAADGEVADIFTLAIPDQDFFEGGWGWGNFVVVYHGQEFYTLYAHLDKVLVTIGQKVKSGVTIAIIGKTGLAGGIVHLHFGLFQGVFKKNSGGNPPQFPLQVPIEKILTMDLDQNEDRFTFHKGLDIVGIPLMFGDIYASENDVGYKPRLVRLPKSLRDSLVERRKSLISYLKNDPFEIMKMDGNLKTKEQIELIKKKIKTIY